MTSPRATLATIGVLMAACGPAPAPTVAAAPPTTAGTTPQDFMPLTPGTLWNFQTSSESSGARGMAVMEVTARHGGDVTLTIAGKRHRYMITKVGIQHIDGGFLLRSPLKRGATFKGSDGQVTVSRVGLDVTVPAGTFRGCLETVEDAARMRVTTVFCPKTGIVKRSIEGETDQGYDRIEYALKYHGEKVDIDAL